MVSPRPLDGCRGGQIANSEKKDSVCVNVYVYVYIYDISLPLSIFSLLLPEA